MKDNHLTAKLSGFGVKKRKALQDIASSALSPTYDAHFHISIYILYSAYLNFVEFLTHYHILNDSAKQLYNHIVIFMGYS